MKTKIKRFPKSSLSSQQAGEVLRSVTGTGNSRDLKLKKFEASRQKFLIFHLKRSKPRGIKPKWKITKKMTFSEIMKKYPELTNILFEKGLYCVGCYFASHETIEQGAKSHGINPTQLVKELNDAVERNI